ncbi:rhomboid family intramembrane serine protease [Streptomyces showdoensis]|uniref:Membrane protein n=1 Tax=Streptomyces showdoensis TaxID=68268 RepID=A0A2P2GLH9_STREW|nr:rhomboid family intramembrane serine protease [Streptomyces showdoensis]KKZ72367.1 membrane protein [Streptomyces showdoensis]
MIDWRGTARGTWQGARNGPTVTYGLIALCVLLFALSPVSGLNPGYGTGDRLLAAQSAYFERWGVIPAELMAGRPRALLTPLTALFVHGSWLHLLGNMLFLYVFGAMAEERMGPVSFALFYLGCGYLALLGYAAAHADSEQTLVGASGAISGVLGAFLYLFPRSRVTSLFPFLFFLPLRFPAWIVLIFWFALQWLAARSAGAGPGVAYLAHVVGFALGFLYAWGRYRGGVKVKPPAAATEGESQP